MSVVVSLIGCKASVCLSVCPPCLSQAGLRREAVALLNSICLSLFLLWLINHTRQLQTLSRHPISCKYKSDKRTGTKLQLATLQAGKLTRSIPKTENLEMFYTSWFSNPRAAGRMWPVDLFCPDREHICNDANKIAHLRSENVLSESGSTQRCEKLRLHKKQLDTRNIKLILNEY